MNKIQSLKTSRNVCRVLAIICGVIAIFLSGEQMLPPLLLGMYCSLQSYLEQIRLDIAERQVSITVEVEKEVQP
jgi:hypothetical protein